MHDFLASHGYPALFCLSFLAATLIPIGSEWLLVALILKGFDPLPTIAVASAGNYLGACTSFLLGAWCSQYFAARVLRVSPAERERAERFFARFGSWSLLFTWLPVIGDPLCLVAGLLKVGFARFSLLVVAGKAARYTAVAWATITGQGHWG